MPGSGFGGVTNVGISSIRLSGSSSCRILVHPPISHLLTRSHIFFAFLNLHKAIYPMQTGHSGQIYVPWGPFSSQLRLFAAIIELSLHHESHFISDWIPSACLCMHARLGSLRMNLVQILIQDSQAIIEIVEERASDLPVVVNTCLPFCPSSHRCDNWMILSDLMALLLQNKVPSNNSPSYRA